MINSKSFSIRILSLVLAVLMAVTALAPAALALEQPSSVPGTSAILVEPSSGIIMYEQNAYDSIIPASTTKILTALLVVEAAARGDISLDDEIPATQAIIDGVIFDASRISPYIADGEIMTVREYLYCVLLSSDCVACDILGNYISGSVQDFVTKMNERAAELGCRNSQFMNSHGYPTEGHYTCAYDLYLICAEAIKYSEFTEIFGTIKYRLRETNLNPARMLYNTNFGLWNPEKITSIYTPNYYEFMTGGKTGSSTASGNCLVSTAEKDGMKLICVITGVSPGTKVDEVSTNACFPESARLYNWGFENYQHKTAVQKNSVQGAVKVKKSDVDEIKLVAAEEVRLTMAIDDTAAFTTDVNIFEETVKAPVSSGDVLGEMKILQNGKLVTKIDLLAAKSAPEKKGLNAFLVVLILGVIIVAGLMLYIVNCDDPAELTQYKPKNTYRNPQQKPNPRPTQGSERRSPNSQPSANSRYVPSSQPRQQGSRQPQQTGYYKSDRSAYRTPAGAGSRSNGTRLENGGSGRRQ